jgi:hypothetical protein
MAGRVLLVIGLDDKCSDVPGGGRLPENMGFNEVGTSKAEPRRNGVLPQPKPGFCAIKAGNAGLCHDRACSETGEQG